MKILITESQYELIKEQNENPSLQIIEKEVVYTSMTKYNLAKLYYNVVKKIIEFEKQRFEEIIQKSSVTGQFIKNKTRDVENFEKECFNMISKSGFLKNSFLKKFKKEFSKYKKLCISFYGKNKKINSGLNLDVVKLDTSLKKKYGNGYTFVFWMGPYTIEKPIFKDTSIKPSPTGTTTQQVVNKQTTDTTIRTNPVTKFSVTWREDLPSGKVEQNTHYFKTYEEWKEFVTQYPHFSTKNENGSKTEAQALYSGLHADISKDKTY